MRIEITLTTEMADFLQLLAEKNSRTRKNYIENLVKENLEANGFDKNSKKPILRKDQEIIHDKIINNYADKSVLFKDLYSFCYC